MLTTSSSGCDPSATLVAPTNFSLGFVLDFIDLLGVFYRCAYYQVHLGINMTKFANIILACLIAMAFVAAPFSASAKRKRDNPNYGFCKSGKQVSDVKQCKENGGRE
jgi:hypothetical protein